MACVSVYVRLIWPVTAGAPLHKARCRQTMPLSSRSQHHGGGPCLTQSACTVRRCSTGCTSHHSQQQQQQLRARCALRLLLDLWPCDRSGLSDMGALLLSCIRLMLSTHRSRDQHRLDQESPALQDIGHESGAILHPLLPSASHRQATMTSASQAHLLVNCWNSSRGMPRLSNSTW